MKSLNNKKGVALLISLWILIILSLIVGSIAIEMNIEGLLLSKKRKSFNSEVLALSGIDYARAIIEMNNKLDSKAQEMRKDKEELDISWEATIYKLRKKHQEALIKAATSGNKSGGGGLSSAGPVTLTP